MNDPLIKRWVVVGVIWGAVLLLVYGNRIAIRNIQLQRENAEAVQMDARFVEKNRDEITRVIKRRADYRQPVESTQIGCLALKNRLRTLASAHNLTVMEMESDSDPAADGGVPIRISIVGAYADALAFLVELEKTVTYAPAARILVKHEMAELAPRFDLQLNYFVEPAET